MDLTYELAPIAGEVFRLTADNFSGSLDLKVYVAEKLIMSHECPDPPCHETIEIAGNMLGKNLRLIAKDMTGAEEILNFDIVGKLMEEM